MFKKFTFIIIILLASIILFLPQVNAQTNDLLGWQINSFDSKIEVKKDGSLNINEMIDVNFNIEKHGIYRTIPIYYKDKRGNNVSIRVKVNSVTDDKGSLYKVKTSKEGKNLKVRIGDPDKTVTGHFVYNINYSVERVLIFNNNGKDEFYWNVTGNADQWEVPISKVSGQIILPSEINKDIEAYCWTGNFGSTEKNCQISTQNNIVNFSATDFLTVSVKFPSGYITKPSTSQQIIWFLKDNFIWLAAIILPILVLIFMFLLWLIGGRDPAGRGTIIAEFESPDNLRPTEVGLLYDNKIQSKDITATIVDLAVRGYLKIVEKEDKKYDIVLLKKEYINDKSLKQYEVSILNDIFAGKEQVDLDDLKNKFYKYLNKIQTEVADGLVVNGYYKKNPVRTRNHWIGAISVLAFMGFFLISALKGAVISYYISLGIIAAFGLAMTKRTVKGAETLEKIKGLRLYIDTAERYRVKFQEKENIFEKFLPYAMVFGLADKWAQTFKDIYKEPPSWYEGYHGTFTTLYFVNSMNSFNNTFSTNISSSPSSGTGAGGSGGFSGGGFGGGGGGSW